MVSLKVGQKHNFNMEKIIQRAKRKCPPVNKKVKGKYIVQWHLVKHAGKSKIFWALSSSINFDKIGLNITLWFIEVLVQGI